MIYIDRPRSFAHKRKKYAHMMSLDLATLHECARHIGVKRHFFDKDHYDITEEQWHYAVLAGAQVVTSRELVEIRRKLRKK